jgi:hypothetical protein
MKKETIIILVLFMLCISSSFGVAAAYLIYGNEDDGQDQGGDSDEDDGQDQGGDSDEDDGQDPEPCEGSWSEWSGCSEPCGGGIKTRTWTTSPGGEPKYGGTACPSPTTREEACNTSACPAEPCEGSWSEWSGCSEPCGGGIKTRTWTTSPGGEPKYGGTACPSPKIESDDCNTQACPSTSPAPQSCQGSWSGWSGWSDCSATCGGGIKTRTKTWTTSPGGESRYGGAACPPNKKEEEECNTQACSVNWDGSTTSTSGSPTWEEFPSLILSGTKLSSVGGGDISPTECKQKCIDNSACGGITTKKEKQCFLYGGDAMPDPQTAGNWWTSYTLVR